MGHVNNDRKARLSSWLPNSGNYQQYWSLPWVQVYSIHPKQSERRMGFTSVAFGTMQLEVVL